MSFKRNLQSQVRSDSFASAFARCISWYWNRYPGASSDSESWIYSFAFSRELEQEWNWSCRFPEQAEILRYLNYTADKFNLKPEFDFNTKVTSCKWDDAQSKWIVETNKGEKVSASFLITCVGCLSSAQVPNIPGRESFKGRSFHTGLWPHEPIDFTGRRVAVIGTGSSGIQSIPIIAKTAAKLTVFQRTPQFTVPNGNYVLSPERIAEIKEEMPRIREVARYTTIGQPYDWLPIKTSDVSREEVEARFEEDWNKGGFAWMFGSYADLVVSKEANDLAADFVRNKIKPIVKDPETARKLIPEGYPIATKRLPLDNGYYETYNRPNVSLVSLRETPIDKIVENGIQTSDGTVYELDDIVFATGFDAMTGPLLRLNITGRNGVTLVDKWAEGPKTYLGLMVNGFPGMFMVTGPGSPSVLGNMPTSIEQHVDFIIDSIKHVRENGVKTVEPTVEAEEKWGEHVKELADATLFPHTDSWYMGANIPNKVIKKVRLFGLDRLLTWCCSRGHFWRILEGSGRTGSFVTILRRKDTKVLFWKSRICRRNRRIIGFQSLFDLIDCMDNHFIPILRQHQPQSHRSSRSFETRH